MTAAYQAFLKAKVEEAISTGGLKMLAAGEGAGVSPRLAAAIDAARDLAWRPTANLGAGLRYTERREAHDRLCALLCGVRLPADASDELRFLLAAMRRVAGCSFVNRRGEPYYWRKQQIYELRGCLDVWDRSVAA